VQQLRAEQLVPRVQVRAQHLKAKRWVPMVHVTAQQSWPQYFASWVQVGVQTKAKTKAKTKAQEFAPIVKASAQQSRE
jgi:hypothetical protein